MAGYVTPKLRELVTRLSHINDFGFLTMAWSTHALQTGREGSIRKGLFRYPKEAASDHILSGHSVQAWEIETLVNLLLTTPKTPGFAWEPAMDTGQFETIRVLTNLLRSAEDGETPLRINNENIIDELHRIGHRQFPWQRTWVRSGELYKYLYIYCQGACADYFKEKYGLDIIEYVSAAFILFTQHISRAWMPELDTREKLPVSPEAIHMTTKLLSSSIWAAHREAAALVNKFEAEASAPIPVAYQPSYLRLKPIISCDRARTTLYTAPLPALILLRVTAGLFYDLASGKTPVINDANARFEEYSRKIIKAFIPDFEPLPSEKYRHKKNPVDTPDILLKLDGKIVSVMECKATKLTYAAQYGENPREDAREGYDQIVKAIFQLWRYFAHVRQKVLNHNLADDVTGVILTLDSWTQMGGKLRDKLIAEAKVYAANKDSSITEADMRTPVFCPIQELDDIMSVSSAVQLLETFHRMTEIDSLSWNIRQKRDEVAPRQKAKSYPFDPGELMPLWAITSERRWSE
ncbi:hypothetical protein CN138_12945 [Sinorhizobium meliloti]|uniref:hypothetical protein n=1 Tax=Rhizobium meliloti TaxID=382 RepID=UPI000FD3E7B2|nr:hypothetical protein [Sinorhizobium meliloti]RVK12983.1 hypothetical protein CN164_11230 [Sinorhizobium meliloti]RVL53366.1 hypothetical protein CN145_09375 [Sinorhizobium meliloti]RVL71189.1 hypothetical protein CN138_12945 [Sinorhizobium meliloti]RVM27758.1 hypothetical protein CN130_23780 [Sinorhizobium meliloti]RVP62724.1 hypothetical protein CN076_05625 [Sinorhizobium meliloti]